MKISIIGTGYVGLVSGTCFAELGHETWCIDIDKGKIEALRNGIIPIFEDGLEALVKKNVEKEKLYFTTDYSEAIPDSEVVLIAVGTPPKGDGSADLKFVKAAADEISKHLNQYTVIANKSTVPVGTTEIVEGIIKKGLESRGVSLDFDVVSNPEFLREGRAIKDFLQPDRVIIGSDCERATRIMQKLYNALEIPQDKIFVMDTKSAEISKYAANTMLAVRISFMNEISKLCEKTGGDILQVQKGIGSDHRIGPMFLNAGHGYGGSCLPKDVRELIATGKRYGLNMRMAETTEIINELQKNTLLNYIKNIYGKDLTGKVFTVWGLSFKPDTDDVRESPAINIIRELCLMGGLVKANDPEAMQNFKKLFNDEINIEFYDDQYEALTGSDALLVVTEWKQYKKPDFGIIMASLKRPIILDGRNQYALQEMKQLGFDYYSIGRKSIDI